MFFEVCMRLAKDIYYTAVRARGDYYSDDEIANEYRSVKIHQAFNMFYKNDLTQFRSKVDINW